MSLKINALGMNNNLAGDLNKQSQHLGRSLYTLPALVPQYKDGGPVTPKGAMQFKGPGTGKSDSIPAKLQVGSVVLPIETVQKYGADKLKAMMALFDTGDPAEGNEEVDAKVSNGEMLVPSSVTQQTGSELWTALIESSTGEQPQPEMGAHGEMMAAGGGLMDERMASQQFWQNAPPTPVPVPGRANPPNPAELMTDRLANSAQATAQQAPGLRAQMAQAATPVQRQVTTPIPAYATPAPNPNPLKNANAMMGGEAALATGLAYDVLNSPQNAGQVNGAIAGLKDRAGFNPASTPYPSLKNYAKGGEVKGYKKGGEVDDETLRAASSNLGIPNSSGQKESYPFTSTLNFRGNSNVPTLPGAVDKAALSRLPPQQQGSYLSQTGIPDRVPEGIYPKQAPSVYPVPQKNEGPVMQYLTDTSHQGVRPELINRPPAQGNQGVDSSLANAARSMGNAASKGYDRFVDGVSLGGEGFSNLASNKLKAGGNQLSSLATSAMAAEQPPPVAPVQTTVQTPQPPATSAQTPQGALPPKPALTESYPSPVVQGGLRTALTQEGYNQAFANEPKMTPERIAQIDAQDAQRLGAPSLRGSASQPTDAVENYKKFLAAQLGYEQQRDTDQAIFYNNHGAFLPGSSPQGYEGAFIPDKLAEDRRQNDLTNSLDRDKMALARETANDAKNTTIYDAVRNPEDNTVQQVPKSGPGADEQYQQTQQINKAQKLHDYYQMLREEDPNTQIPPEHFALIRSWLPQLTINKK